MPNNTVGLLRVTLRVGSGSTCPSQRQYQPAFSARHARTELVIAVGFRQARIVVDDLALDVFGYTSPATTVRAPLVNKHARVLQHFEGSNAGRHHERTIRPDQPDFKRLRCQRHPLDLRTPRWTIAYRPDAT